MTVPRLVGSIVATEPDADSSDLLVLLPSLGTTTELWSGVVTELVNRSPRPRILTVDLPGHGASPVATEPFTVSELAEATLRLVDEVGGGRFAVAGVSLGGAIALELALAHPARVSALSVICSGARIGSAESWGERAEQVRASGTASLVTGSASRWFAPGFLETPHGAAGARALAGLVDVDDASYTHCTAALGAFDRTADLAAVAAPTLVLSGAADEVTTSESLRALAEAIPGARFAEIAEASHLAVLERPEESARQLLELLARGNAPTTLDDVHARGMRTRRGVLGDAHVDAAVAGTTPETADFQDFITRYAWGEVWSREALTRRERSIATLAVLVADGHEHELRMHLRAGLRNGLTREELAEVILHTALYAGLPPANGAFAILREVFAELDAESPEGDSHG